MVREEQCRCDFCRQVDDCEAITLTVAGVVLRVDMCGTCLTDVRAVAKAPRRRLTPGERVTQGLRARQEGP